MLSDIDLSSLPSGRHYRRRQLFDIGLTKRSIDTVLAKGALVRARDGVYVRSDAGRDVIDACRVGGLLGCTSELARLGVFVLESSSLHVHLRGNAARLRSIPRPVRRHWGRLHREPPERGTSVEVFDAVLQALRCQPIRESIATLDSVLSLRLLRPDDLDELFALLPRRFRRIRPMIDPRCESGSETFLRLILRTLGVPFEMQVHIAGVGRVDFLVAGWLIIECDSRAHHSDWDAQREDRRRDQAAAALGFSTYRAIAEDIFWHPDDVRTALAGLLGRTGGAGVRRRAGKQRLRSRAMRRVA